MTSKRAKNSIRTLVSDRELVATRRQHIAKSAAKLFVKKGYDKTSVHEVANACGIGIGTLYRYIGTKEDILYLVIDEGLGKLSDFCTEAVTNWDSTSASQALRTAIKKYYQIIDEFQDLMVLAYQEANSLLPDARKRVLGSDNCITAAFEKVLTMGCETGEFKVRNIALLAHDIVVLGQMWAARRWFLRKRCTFEQYTEEQMALVLNAISTEREDMV
jgi:AcrR family transcriptional regulator